MSPEDNLTSMKETLMRELGMDLSEYLAMRPGADDLAWEHAMDISASVYSRLRELGKTQHELAEKMGATIEEVNRAIRGNPEMSLKELARLEDALGLDLGSGFTYVPQRPSEHDMHSQ